MQSHGLVEDLYSVLLNIFHYIFALPYGGIPWIFIFNIHSSYRYLSLMLDVLVADVRVVIT